MDELKRCPFCAEEIQAAAIKCRHCGEFLDGGGGQQGSAGDGSPVGERSGVHPGVLVAGGSVVGALLVWSGLSLLGGTSEDGLTVDTTTTSRQPTPASTTTTQTAPDEVADRPPVTRLEVVPRSDLSPCVASRLGGGPWGCQLTLLARGQPDIGDGGPADAATLRRPWGVEVGPDGVVYISDMDNNRIRAVTADGSIRTVAGSGAGQVRGTGDGLSATEANLRFPRNVAFGPDGRMFIADSNHYQIRVVDQEGVISTVAGSRDFRYSGDGGPALQAGISFPIDLAIGSDGSVYLTDHPSGRVRVVGPDGIIRTLVNTGDDRPWGLVLDRERGLLYFSLVSSLGGSVQVVDLGTESVTSLPVGGGAQPLALDTAGNLYVAGEEAVSVYAPETGEVQHLGLPDSMRRRTPSGIAVGDDGTVYIADAETNMVWTLRDGTFMPFAGSSASPLAYMPLDAAPVPESQGIAYDAFGNLYWADFNRHQIMRLSTDGLVTTVAGTGGGDSSGDGGHPLEAEFNHPRRLVFDSAGNLLFIDAFEGTASIRSITPGGDGVVDGSPDERIVTVAGRSAHRSEADGGEADGGPATSAVFTATRGFALASDGRLFVSDWLDNRIRMVTPGPDGIVNGGPGEIITTIAGTGERSSTGDGGPASEATVYDPVWMEVDSEDNLYFYEDERRVIRRIDARTGIITTFTEIPGEILWSFTFDADDALIYSTSREIVRVDPVTGEHEVLAGAGRPGLVEDDGNSVTLDGVAALAFDGIGTFALIENATNSLYLMALVPLVDG